MALIERDRTGFRPDAGLLLQPILSERGVRHRRNALLAAFALMTLAAFPPLAANLARLIGLYIGSQEAGLALLLGALGLALAYHLLGFLVYAVRSLQNWRFLVTDKGQNRSLLPELAMYFGRGPSRALTARSMANEDIFSAWTYSEFDGCAHWVLSVTHPRLGDVDRYSLTCDKEVIRFVRRRLADFFAIDLMLPALLLVASGAVLWFVRFAM